MSAPVGPGIYAHPVRIVDRLNNSLALLVNADGSINVNAAVSGLTTLSVTQGTVPWVVSGTITANQGTNPWITDGSGSTQPVSGSVSVVNFPATQVVSGTVTANAGTNLNTSALALDTSVNSLLKPASTLAALTVLGSITSAVTVIQPTAANLNVTVGNFPPTQPVSGTVTVNNITGTAALPTGASTSALQTTGNTSLSTIATQTTAINGKMSALGQNTMANSMPVAIASNQSAIPVTGTFFQATQPVSGTFFQATQPVSGTVTANAGTGTFTVSSKVALTASSPTAASVGVATAQALASNASRKGLILVNSSSNIISIGIGSAAVLNSGITLYPAGSFQMDEYCFATGAINAIASVAASSLSIQEFT